MHEALRLLVVLPAEVWIFPSSIMSIEARSQIGMATPVATHKNPINSGAFGHHRGLSSCYAYYRPVGG